MLQSVNLRLSHLETVRAPSTTGLLKLASFRLDSGLDAVVSMRVVDRGAVTEVPDTLASILRTSEKNDAGASGASQSQLVKGEALASRLDDTSASSLRESKSTDGQSRHLKKTDVIGDPSDNDSDLLLLASHVSRQARKRKRSSVNP